jgi:hypothetical protein
MPVASRSPESLREMVRVRYFAWLHERRHGHQPALPRHRLRGHGVDRVAQP